MIPETHDPESGPRWQRRKDARPTELLEAAFHEFVTRGFTATRLEDIAKRAGCTKGTIFLYFENKEELFKEMVRHILLPHLAETEQRVEQHEGSMRDLLETILRTKFERMSRPPFSGMPKLIFGEVAHFPDMARFYHEEVIARSHRAIAQVLERGIELGEFRPMDTSNVARTAVAPLILASLWMHSFAPHTNEHIDPSAFFEASLGVLLRGITRDVVPGGSHE